MPVPFGELKPCVYYTQGTRRYLCLLTTNATKSANWPGIRFLARASVRGDGARLFSAVCGDRAHTQMRLGSALCRLAASSYTRETFRQS